MQLFIRGSWRTFRDREQTSGQLDQRQWLASVARLDSIQADPSSNVIGDLRSDNLSRSGYPRDAKRRTSSEDGNLEPHTPVIGDLPVRSTKHEDEEDTKPSVDIIGGAEKECAEQSISDPNNSSQLQDTMVSTASGGPFARVAEGDVSIS